MNRASGLAEVTYRYFRSQKVNRPTIAGKRNSRQKNHSYIGKFHYKNAGREQKITPDEMNTHVSIRKNISELQK